MVYTGKLFGFVEFFEIFQEYSRNMQIFNVHPGTFSTFQEYAWYIVCCTGKKSFTGVTFLVRGIQTIDRVRELVTKI